MSDSLVRIVITGDSTGARRAFDETALAAERTGTRMGDSMDRATTRMGGALSRASSLGASFGVPFVGSLDAVGKKFDEASAKGHGFSQAMSSLGGATLLGGAAGFAVAGTAAVKMATDFQGSMELIHTQAGATQGEVDKMSKAVLALSGPTATAPEQLSEALYHIESTGVRGTQAVNELRTATEGAKVGHANLTDVTNALNASIASGIPGVQNMGQAMGALNSIVGAGDMHMQDLSEALGTGVLAVVKGYGLSLNDVGAALATFGDNNIRGADASTKLRTAVQAMAVPAKAAFGDISKQQDAVTTSTAALSKAQEHLQQVQQRVAATGKPATVSQAQEIANAEQAVSAARDKADKAQQTLQAAATDPAALGALTRIGITQDQLAKDMQTGGLNKAISDLHAHLQSAGITGDQVGEILTQAFGKKAGPGIAILVDQFSRFQSKVDEVGRGAGHFGEDYKATTQTLSFQFDQVRATAESVGISFGEFLLPKVEDLMRGIKDTVGWFEKHKQVAEALGVVIGGTLATAVAVFTYGKLADLAKGVRGIVSDFGSLGSKVAGIFGGGSGSTPTISADEAATKLQGAATQLSDSATQISAAADKLAGAGTTAGTELESAGTTAGTNIGAGAAGAEAGLEAAGTTAGANIGAGAATAEANLAAGGATAEADLVAGGATAQANVTAGGASAGADMAVGGATAEADMETGGAAAQAELTTGGATAGAETGSGGLLGAAGAAGGAGIFAKLFGKAGKGAAGDSSIIDMVLNPKTGVYEVPGAGAKGGLLSRLLGLGGGGAAEGAGLLGPALMGGGLTMAGVQLYNALGEKPLSHAVGKEPASVLGDVGTGAGLGATVGMMGGPFAPISVPVGAAIGAALGGLLSQRGHIGRDTHAVAHAWDDTGGKVVSAIAGFFGAHSQQPGVAAAKGAQATDQAKDSTLRQQMGQIGQLEAGVKAGTVSTQALNQAATGQLGRVLAAESQLHGEALKHTSALIGTENHIAALRTQAAQFGNEPVGKMITSTSTKLEEQKQKLEKLQSTLATEKSMGASKAAMDKTEQAIGKQQKDISHTANRLDDLKTLQDKLTKAQDLEHAQQALVSEDQKLQARIDAMKERLHEDGANQTQALKDMKADLGENKKHLSSISDKAGTIKDHASHLGNIRDHAQGIDTNTSLADSLLQNLGANVGTSVSNALGGLPHHAEGGVASGWSWVGEEGKELAYFGSPTGIIPAGAAAALAGGTSTPGLVSSALGSPLTGSGAGGSLAASGDIVLNLTIEGQTIDGQRLSDTIYRKIRITGLRDSRRLPDRQPFPAG